MKRLKFSAVEPEREPGPLQTREIDPQDPAIVKDLARVFELAGREAITAKQPITEAGIKAVLQRLLDLAEGT